MKTFVFQVGERRLELKVDGSGRLVKSRDAEEVLQVFNSSPEDTVLTILRHCPNHLRFWIDGTFNQEGPA